MRTRTGFIGCVAVGLVCLFAAAFAAPAGAITGGTDDDPTNPRHPEVGLVVFYQPDGRFRCSGTLIDPQVVLTAGHCTFGDVGQVIVTFDTQVAQSIEQGRLVVPRALDDPGTGLEGSGYDDGLWVVETDAEGTPLICGPEDVVQRGCTEGEVLRHEYDNSGWDDGTADGAPVYHLGTAIAHPDYSDFTDIRNWNDTGVVVLDEPIVGIAPAPLAPEGYLDSLTQPQLVKTLFHTVGYGTEVRQADTGPQVPTPQSYPLRRQYTDEKGQKLTPQILQLNGNEHDPFGGGGTCFGDSGGPGFLDGYVVGDTSYGYTDNCRYLGGYQRVDIPVVHAWLEDCLADLACPGKT